MIKPKKIIRDACLIRKAYRGPIVGQGAEAEWVRLHDVGNDRNGPQIPLNAAEQPERTRPPHVMQPSARRTGDLVDACVRIGVARQAPLIDPSIVTPGWTRRNRLD